MVSISAVVAVVRGKFVKTKIVKIVKTSRILLLILALGVTLVMQSSKPADAAPFTATCTNASRVFLGLVNGTATPQTTQLVEQNLVPGTGSNPQYTYSNIGAAYNAGGTYNAIGYNSEDGLIYGILGIGAADELVAIDDTGVIVNNLGAVTGLPNEFFQQGAMDNSGNLYIRSSAADNFIYRIDVNSFPLTATQITLNQAINVGDFTFMGGYLWGVNTTGGAPVMRIDVSGGGTTATVTQIPQTIVPDPVNPYAAAWTYGDGSIGIVERETGNFFRFSITNPGDPVPTFTLITSGAVPVNGAINNADGTSCISPPTDIGIEASAPATVTTGSLFNVTYTVTNNGPSGSSGQVVNQTLPPEMINPTTSNPDCSITNVAGQNILNCNHGPMSNGGSFNIVITATAPSTVTCFTNTPDLIPQEADTNSANNQDSVQTCTVLPNADLAIAKRATNPIGGATVTTAVAGTNLNYVIDVTNNGPATAQAVSVTDTLPTGIVPQSAGGTGWTCNIVTQTVTCTRASATLGVAPAITVQAAVDSSATGSLVNDANVTSTTPDPDPNNNDDDVPVTITQDADLGIVKTHAGAPVAGGTYTYDYDVTNNGPSDTPSFTVTDTLNSNLTFVSAGSSLGCSAVGQVVTCTGGSLVVGGSENFTIVVSVSPSFPGGTILNTATVAPPVGVTDSQPANDSSDDSTAIAAVADLDIDKSHATTFVAGENGQYQIVVSNDGPSDAQDVVVTDNLPAGLTYVSGTGTGWTCSNIGSAVSCSRTSLATGATAPTITLTVHLASSYIGSLDNTAIVSSTTDDTDLTNNDDNDPQTIDTEADMAIVKTLTSGPLVAGSSETYRLTVTNNGPSDARTLSITDQLPAGLTYMTFSGSGWNCSVNVTQLITCTNPYMVTGQTSTIDVTVALAPTATGSILNAATVASVTPDPIPGNNTDDTTDPITEDADLAITKTHPNQTFKAGDTVTFTLSIVNNGPSTAANVVATDTLPAGLEYVSADPGLSGFSCTNSGQTVSCTASTLSIGAPVNIAVTTRINSNFGSTSAQNNATVATSTTDTVGSNNSASDVVQIIPTLGGVLANTGQSMLLPLIIAGTLLSSAAVITRLRSKFVS